METKKRVISAYVENQIGVLAKVSGLFSGKNYNLDTLTVGMTEDPTISRMTIGLTCDDLTFEQIIKQLNRSVEVIKVLDFTDIPSCYILRFIAAAKRTSRRFSGSCRPSGWKWLIMIGILYWWNVSRQKRIIMT